MTGGNRLSSLVGSASIVMAVALLGDSMLYAVLPTQAAELGIPTALLGVLLSVNRWVRLLTNSVAAVVFRRWGARRGMAFGALLTIGSTTAYGVFPYFAAMLPARMAWGGAYSLLRLGCYGAVLHEATELTRGRLMGLYTSISRMGSVVAAVLGGILAEVLGFRWTAVAFGLMGMFILTLSIRVGRTLDQSTLPLPAPTPRRRRWMPRLHAGLRLGFIASVSSFVGHGVVVASVGLLLVERYGAEVPLGDGHVGAAVAAGILVAIRFAGDLLSPIFGHASDRRGRGAVAWTSGIATVIGIVALTLVPHPVAFTLATTLVFLATSAFQIALETWTADAARGSDWTGVMSQFATLRDIGTALGPLLALPLAAVFGFEPVFLGVAVVLAVALALLPRRRGGLAPVPG